MKAIISSLLDRLSGIRFHTVIGLIGSALGLVGAVLGRLIRRLLSLILDTKMGRSLQRVWRVRRAADYRFLLYATAALRVLAWVTLALGFAGSLAWGLYAGGVEGVLLTTIGVAASFAAWLLMLAAKQLLSLFMDVKGNTKSTAGQILRGRHQAQS